MRKSKFPQSQIAAILREAEAGVPVAELLRKHEGRGLQDPEQSCSVPLGEDFRYQFTSNR